MDLTWTLYQRGSKVRFLPDAVFYPIEPHNLDPMRKQLRRWSHGFIQNVQPHWQGVLGLGHPRSTVLLVLWNSIIASIGYRFAIPLLAILVNAAFLFAYVLDAPVILISVLLSALPRRAARGARRVFRLTSHSASRTR